MANPPPPYANITGISRTVMKDNAQETLGNYNGNARPGEIVADLTTDPPALYIGNNLGQLTAIAGGGGASLPLANGTSSFNIPAVNGNVTVTTAGANTFTFGTNGNLTLPGNTSNINYANGDSILDGYATISSVYTSNTTTQSINVSSGGGTYYNASTLEIDYTAYTGASVLNFDIAYQAPLDANIGVSVSAVSTPLIQSNVNIELQANTGTAQTWTFGTDGNLTLPSQGNLVGFTANNLGHLQWIGNSSGDGAGYTTLQLVPDDTLTGGDQYLIIDPTAGGHIHIRAGGTQDNSAAFLYLGGENSYFQVPAGNDPSVYIAASNNVWDFGNDGVLYTPGNVSVSGNVSASGNVTAGNISTTGSGGDITLTGGDILGVNIVVTTPVPVANLTAVAGGRAFVNNSNVVSLGNFGNIVSSGGSNVVPVWSDGINWYIG